MVIIERFHNVKKLLIKGSTNNVNLIRTKVFPGSRNLAPDSCVTVTTQESGARLREPGKTLPLSVKRTNISPNLTLLPNSRLFLPFLICRTSPWTCTFVSFGLIPAYHSSDVRGSKSWWWVLNTLIWFGYPIHSLSMKKRPTSTKPRRKTNSSESCIQGKFCEVLGTFSQTTHTAQNSDWKCTEKMVSTKVFSWLLIRVLDEESINPVERLH